jgi:hypothetical protein
VLAYFNQDADLDHLGIGDELRVPVLGEQLADAEPRIAPTDPM